MLFNSLALLALFAVVRAVYQLGRLPTPQRWRSSGILAVALVAYGAGWRAVSQEVPSTDPWAYSRNAFHALQLLTSHPVNHPFTERIGVYLPVSVAYALFGVGPYATHLWPLLSAMIVVATVWFALPRRERMLGLVLSATSVPLLASSMALYPDGIAAALMGWSALLVGRRLESRRTKELALATALLAFGAFLAKETAIWWLPCWAWTFLRDLVGRRWRLVRSFHVPVLVAGLLLATAYGYFCWRVWGSPWARFQSVQDVSSQHLWSLGGKSRDALVRRLTSGPVGLFESQYGNLIPLAAMGLLLRSRRAGVWPAYVAATVLGFWLGPTSLRSFSPLPLEPRMTLPCLPGLLVMASLGVGTLLRADLPRFATLVGRLTALGVLVAAGLLPMWRYARTLPRSETPERRAMAVVRDDVAAAPERRFALVCAETRSRDYLSWFWGYKYPPNLAVLMPDELSGSHLSDDTRVYLYVNEGRARFLHQAYGEREYGRAFASRGYPLAFHVADALLYSTTAGALARGGPF